MEEGSTARRVLMAAVIGMGVLIVAGVGLLVAVILHRVSHPHAAVTPPPVLEKPIHAETLLLHEPEGSHVATMAWRDGNVLALSLTGGGPDRIVLWDVTQGRVIGRLEVGR
ncbi:hypothetical protein AA0472_1409 [Acetobacter estunensis NRIC 0472]|uniref:WD40 repeat domain-containing protein n=1 Tax=Acetobacter estunensis TaxID=104097 RepID=A0A967B514_9PROT|nr:hypothetical protein [Acetobacter estunensis]NHO53900.1 hypothetical protein [Acetobacter estunensis]GBQ24395.1 hypothetical protein AA0472_1409 [Acetobacter estunensis NRIC 0472]